MVEFPQNLSTDGMTLIILLLIFFSFRRFTSILLRCGIHISTYSCLSRRYEGSEARDRCYFSGIVGRRVRR